jgi:Leucine-rich repeat (LRR) protein
MLTKEFILTKYTKFSDITELKSLNIWGEDLQDISIISKMPNLEILSLSSNRISSLSPLSACLNMREIYLRNNNITSFEELNHLRHLFNLKVLWLEGNPICDDIFYREKVLNLLPQIIYLDNKSRLLKREKVINNRKRIQSEEQKKRKNEFDYDANISKSNRKKILLRRVFSYLDSTNDGKIIETSNEISLNNQNKKNNKNFFLNKKNDLSELKLIFHTKGNSDKKDKQFFRKLKLKIKKEENKNNFYLGNNNMFNNYLGNAPRISKKKLTVETNPITNPMPRIKERDSTTVQNSISIEAFKGNMFRNINNDKFTINNNCNNSNYIMKAIYLLVDKMNVNDLISLKDAINQKIAILTKTN